MEKEVKALERLAGQKQPLAIDEEMTKELERLAKSLDRLQKRAEALAENEEATGADIEQELRQLADALRQERERLDSETMEPLEKLAAVVPLARDEARFAQLYLRQRDLADRLVSLKGVDRKDDPAFKARVRDFEDEQRKIRSDLAQLLDDIEEHAARLPEEDEFEALRLIGRSNLPKRFVAGQGDRGDGRGRRRSGGILGDAGPRGGAKRRRYPRTVRKQRGRDGPGGRPRAAPLPARPRERARSVARPTAAKLGVRGRSGKRRRLQRRDEHNG